MSRSRRFDPEKFYHVTLEPNLPSIRKYGLLPGDEIGKSHYSYVFLTKGGILPSRAWSPERYRILEVDVTGLNGLEDFSQFREEPQYVINRVPPSNLKLLRKSTVYKTFENAVIEYETVMVFEETESGIAIASIVQREKSRSIVVRYNFKT